MKRFARGDVHRIGPEDAIATRKETSHASGMEKDIIGGLVILMLVNKIYCK